MVSVTPLRHTPSTRSEETGRHVVQRGDTLSRIAKEHGLSVAELREANPRIDSSRDLREGATLRIPTSARGDSEAAPANRHFSSDAGGDVHPGIRAQLLAAAASTPADHLRRGDRGAAVDALRQDLQRLGYLTRDQQSDVFGVRMERAVEAFQDDLGIQTTGVVGPIARGAMRDLVESIGVGRNADASHIIRDVQSHLFRLGYFDGRPLGNEKGTYGPRTEAAVERFQRDNDLPVSGRVGIGTFRELNDPATANLREGDRGPGVAALREDLQQMGYLTKAQKSDIFGERMERAVRAFQRDIGIAATGVAGPTTTGNLEALTGGVGIGRTSKGEAAEAIRAIQSRLFELGYFDGRPLGNEKGDFGPRTEAAVRRFQRDENLRVSGRVGAGTFEALQNARPDSSGGLVKPLDARLTAGSEFASPDAEGAPSRRGGRFHAAKDWFAPGGTAVRAPVDGTIVDIRPSRGNSGQIFGGVVRVQAGDGKVWVFRHVDPGSVRVGQRVDAGDRIASVTRWADGPSHAHIELWKTRNGDNQVFENMIDPMKYLGRFV